MPNSSTNRATVFANDHYRDVRIPSTMGRCSVHLRCPNWWVYSVHVEYVCSFFADETVKVEPYGHIGRFQRLLRRASGEFSINSRVGWALNPSNTGGKNTDCSHEVLYHVGVNLLTFSAVAGPPPSNCLNGHAFICKIESQRRSQRAAENVTEGLLNTE